MSRSTFNRVIDSLEVIYHKSGTTLIKEGFEIKAQVRAESVLIQQVSGESFVGKDYEKLNPGEYYFIPRGAEITIRYGRGPYTDMGPDGLLTLEDQERFLQPVSLKDKIPANGCVIRYVDFSMLIHNAISIFLLLGIPAFKIERNDSINDVLKRMLIEEDTSQLGKNMILGAYGKELSILISRLFFDRPEFKSKVEKLDYLLDRRLINIINYVQENLGGELTNSKISAVAFVSKDYVGQFFKAMTQLNLQDYIEQRRLEKAYQMLRSSNDNIQEIAQRLGFKDPAYFSRRFKKHFNVVAKDVRRSDPTIL